MLLLFLRNHGTDGAEPTTIGDVVRILVARPNVRLERAEAVRIVTQPALRLVVPET